jgi:hypothetical protein
MQPMLKICIQTGEGYSAGEPSGGRREGAAGIVIILGLGLGLELGLGLGLG